jgi:hypothetical protein
MKRAPTSRRSIAAAVIALLVAVAVPAAAQDQDASQQPPYETFPRALGAAFGPITGTGLHFHRWAGDVGFGLAGGIVYFPADTAPGDSTLDYNVGGAVQWRVYGDRFADWLTGSLYVFGGGHHRGYIPVVYSGTDPRVAAGGSFQVELGVGVGIGIEIILFEHFSIPVEFGYGANWNATEANLAEAFLVQLYPQTALRYRY